MSESSTSLISPYAPLNLKNRSVMAPMTRFACTSDGCPTEELKAYYLRRAENDVGLIIVESCAINPSDAMGYINGAQFHKASHAESWKDVVDKVHATGAKIWIQLFHPGRLTVKEVTGERVLAPSAIAPFEGRSFWRPEVDGQVVNFQTGTAYTTPAAMRVEEIEHVVAQFAHACSLAAQAGFDGVELHGAHGYLLHQFCHRATNCRSDAYAPSSGFPFIEAVVTACRKALGDNRTLSYRLSVHMVDNVYVRYEKSAFDHGDLVRKLDEWGVDVFHSSELKVGMNIFDGTMPLHQLIREQTDKAIIACGSIRSRAIADKILAQGTVDLVAFGRNLISNPGLIRLFVNDDNNELVKFDYTKHIAIIY